MHQLDRPICCADLVLRLPDSGMIGSHSCSSYHDSSRALNELCHRKSRKPHNIVQFNQSNLSHKWHKDFMAFHKNLVKQYTPSETTALLRFFSSKLKSHRTTLQDNVPVHAFNTLFLATSSSTSENQETHEARIMYWDIEPYSFVATEHHSTYYLASCLTNPKRYVQSTHLGS